MIRRLCDIMLAALLLIVCLPALLVIAAAVVLDSRGGVWYRSPRVGLAGREFSMVKFRTMLRDGDVRLDERQREELRTTFKLTRDPRITPVGGWLRRYSLDELPQLFNVLSGDMALVGPRPKLPEEIDLYGDQKAALLSVRPGMTGLWQVSRTSGQSDAFMRETDLRYVRSRSLHGDFGILARTIAVVLKGGNG